MCQAFAQTLASWVAKECSELSRLHCTRNEWDELVVDCIKMYKVRTRRTNNLRLQLINDSRGAQYMCAE